MPTTMKYRTLDLAGTTVPVIELTAEQDAPRLTVLAYTDGCEYAPMAAVREWTRDLAAGGGLRGTVTAVPVLNVTSFRSRSAFVTPEDGKNLNRCFPGDPAGTYSDVLAHAIFAELIAPADVLVDLHGGDLFEALEPFAIYAESGVEERSRELAEVFG